MGKRANIQATRYAAEASARELRRQTEVAEEARRAGMTEEERTEEDRAAAAAIEAQAAEQTQLNIVKSILGVGTLALLMIGAYGPWAGLAVLAIAAGIALVVFLRRAAERERRAKAAAEAEAAERAQRAAEAARQAQVEHHVRMLCAGDPVFSGLTEEWQRIPPTRPDARARNEAQQAERLVIIDQYAAQFAELERTGQPVPDHGETMRSLVQAERAWDAGPTGR